MSILSLRYRPFMGHSERRAVRHPAAVGARHGVGIDPDNPGRAAIDPSGAC